MVRLGLRFERSAPERRAGADGARRATATTAPATGYVGEETCLTCHEDQKKGYHGSPHGRAAEPAHARGEQQGCESCHGPGQAHVDGGGDKTKIKNPATMTLRDANATCLSCHNRSTHDNLGRRQARLAQRRLRHLPQRARAEVREGAAEDRDGRGDLRAVPPHAGEQGAASRRTCRSAAERRKMECTTCHNPHGSQNVKMLKEGNSINEACATCHAEKRGPFLWDHQVTRESCTTCHDAHGSNNERMLVAKEPMLCQRCHVSSRHPATIYDQTQVNARSNRVIGRSCTQCHSQIHGSNHPSGNFFLR